MSEPKTLVFSTTWAPGLPCPKGCFALPGKTTMMPGSTIWTMGKDAGHATTECIVCSSNWSWDFAPDVPFEHQKISFRASPAFYFLRGTVHKASRKKGKGNAGPADDSGKPNVS